jgi:hypothetical protein
MRHDGLCCVYCGSSRVKRLRRTPARFSGEFRYCQYYCYGCERPLYIKEKMFEQAIQVIKVFVERKEFDQACDIQPGPVRIGTTASEYSRRVASGADWMVFRRDFRKK